MQTLLTKHLAGLFNGISEQAPTLRLPSQAQTQINGWSSLIHGLTTRPPTRRIALKDVGWDSYTKFHKIDRDSDERYIISTHKNGDIKAFSLSGYEYPIEGKDKHKSYLTSSKPIHDIAISTIADYSFIVNKRVITKMQEATEDTQITSAAQCQVSLSKINGDRITILVDDVIIANITNLSIQDNSYAPATTRPVLEVLSELREAINAHANYSATSVSGSSFTFRRVGGEAFNPSGTGGVSLRYIPPTTTELLWDRVGYIYVAKGVAEQNYRVYIDDALVASYSSGNTNNASTYKTDVVASSLHSQLLTKGYLSELSGSTIRVWKKDGSDFALKVDDSWGNAALKGFKARTQSFSELPARCFNGAILQIVGKSDSSEGSYWVKYETTYVKDGVDMQSTGVWKESRAPFEQHLFDKESMPRQLVRRQDVSKYANTNNPNGIYFTLEFSDWLERKVGDGTSAPAPSFVGKCINDIFLFQNRLGILAGQSVCLSKTGDFQNFFPTTVTDALDDNPIDINAPSTSTPTLYHAVVSRESLMLFANDQQFLLNSSGEPLTAQSVTISSILKYPCDSTANPTLIGQMVYYVSPRGKHASIREYFIQAEGMVSDAPNISSHVPTLIPFKEGEISLCGMANEDILFVSDGSNTLYTYKFAYTGDTKNQSSWSKWEFSFNILSMFEFDNSLYLIFDNGSLEKLSFDLTDTLCVDSLYRLSKGTNIVAGKELNIYKLDRSFIKTLSNETASFDTDVLVGYPYHFTYVFSPLFLQLSNDKAGIIDGATMLRTLELYLEGNMSFELSVVDTNTNKERLKYNYSTPPNAPLRYAKRFLVRGEAKQSMVKVRSTMDRPIILQSASFEILASLRAKPL